MTKKRKRLLIVLKILGLLLLLVIVVILFFRMAPQFGGRSAKDRIAELAHNSVYIDGKFENLNKLSVVLPKSYSKMMRELFRKSPGRIPADPLPSALPAFENPGEIDNLSLIWLGHSTVLIRINGLTIITDPVLSERASPVSFMGPKPFKTTQVISVDDLPPIDVVLISHDHFDHLDYKTIKQLHSTVSRFIVPLGIRDHLEKWGLESEKITESDWWNQEVFNSLQFICTPAQHFSGRRKQDNGTLWCSWVILSNSNRIFYCGDSGYGDHFKEIGERFGPFDITLMESGAYGKFWPYIHMFPEETVQAHIDLRGDILLPVHWGKFNLAFHDWKDPVNRLTKKADELSVKVATPRIGELLVPEKYSLVSYWWSDL